MNGSLTQGAWKIGTVMGIPIRVHFSWLIVFGLITWSLSTYYFPKAAPDLPTASYWTKGALAALLLFASVLFHELAHSFVAKKYKISIESITPCYYAPMFCRSSLLNVFYNHSRHRLRWKWQR